MGAAKYFLKKKRFSEKDKILEKAKLGPSN